MITKVFQAKGIAEAKAWGRSMCPVPATERRPVQLEQASGQGGRVAVEVRYMGGCGQDPVGHSVIRAHGFHSEMRRP